MKATNHETPTPFILCLIPAPANWAASIQRALPLVPEPINLARPISASASAPQQRPPLAEPRPGTVRADVYRALGDGKPHRRAAIVERVAAVRNVKPGPELVSAVGKVIECQWDARIERVSRGIYRLRPASRSASAVQPTTPKAV